MKWFIIPISILGLFILISCNDSSFKGADKKTIQPARPTSASEPAVAAASENNSEPGSGATNPENPGNIDDDGSNCPILKQDILVLDFKSGWWSGDGGDVFKSILGGLSNPLCQQTINVEYHHIVLMSGFKFGTSCEQVTLPNFSQRQTAESTTCANAADGLCECKKTSAYSDKRIIFPEKTEASGEATFGTSILNDIDNYTVFLKSDFSQYTQIWLLSGSEADPVDIKVANTFFVALVDKIKAASSPLFIGAGYGSVDHADALTNALSLGQVFSTSKPGSEIVLVMNGNTLAVKSTITIPETLKSHPLFQNVTDIADVIAYHQTADFNEIGQIITVGPFDKEVKGDSLISGTFLLKDNLQQNTIGTGLIGKRKIVFDAGMPRFYSVSAAINHAGTTMYLKNISHYLSLP